MTNFIFLSGKWWWVKDYPEKRDYQVNWSGDLVFPNGLTRERYEEAISKALEGKVEVAPEDQDEITELAWDAGHTDPADEGIIPVDLEMEIVSENFMTRTQPNPTGRKVARIKPVKTSEGVWNKKDFEDYKATAIDVSIQFKPEIRLIDGEFQIWINGDRWVKADPHQKISR